MPEGRISYGDVGLWDDATEAVMAHTLESMRRWSSMPIALQLARAGRKASTNFPWKGGKMAGRRSRRLRFPFCKANTHPKRSTATA